MMQSNTPERSYWDRNARNYDRSMTLLGGPIRRMRELVACDLDGASRVLELGAGTGLVTVVAARAALRVVATDYSERMLDVLRSRLHAEGITNVEVAVANIDALAFEDESFDAVVAANVLHLMPDMEAAIRAMSRVVRRGGTLIVPTYCHDETRTARVVSRLLALTRFPGRRRLKLQTLHRAVTDAGLEVRTAVRLPGILPIGYVSARRP